MAHEPHIPDDGSKEEPTLGPESPHQQKDKPRRRITSRSFSTNENTGKEYVNSWDVRDMGHELRTNIGGASGEAIDRFAVSSNDPEVIRHWREVQRQAARAAYFEQRVLNAQPIPKASHKKTKSRSSSPKGCPECEGSGMVWFGDAQEPCTRCGGLGTL